ncbi:MAG: EAL domain-containing protein, partial [Alphaproteobacteria bacterium]
VLGYEPEALVGVAQAAVLFGDEVSPMRDLMASRAERREPYRDLEFWTHSKGGDRVCVRVSGVPVMDEAGAFKGYRGAASNITASKLDRENMYRMATSDQLTGLLNRTRFKEELERAVMLSQRHHTTGVMMFIDLDRFKEVNDTHGHEAGDRILQGVAEILRSQMRSTDVVARLGGDEFGIIMHNIDMKTASGKVEKIIERVKAMSLDYNGARLTTTMSIGMVKYPQDEKGVDHLIMTADMAMYRAKDMGRNRLFVDDDDETTEAAGSVREQLKWVERLKVCLETNDFEMHYQAIVPAKPHQRPLFEALLRIYDSTGKVGNPALYIDAAEHFGLIQHLDMAVTRRVLETQLALMRDGVDCDMSINLSCRSLGDETVMAKLKQMLVEIPVDPNRILFEVTETMALHDPAEMRDIGEIHAFITELRALGFRFALDDFGSGFTSFKYLRVLDVDVVKIDGEFVKNIVGNAEDRLFVKHMVQLCQGMGIMVIAEFVEDVPIMDVLLELGVDYGQGWLFAKPRPDIAVACGDYKRKVMGDYRVQEAGSRKQDDKKDKKASPKGNVVKLKVKNAASGQSQRK